MSLKYKELGVLPLPVRDSFKRLSESGRPDLWKLSLKAGIELINTSDFKDLAVEPYYYVSMETGKEGLILIDDRTDKGYFVYEE